MATLQTIPADADAPEGDAGKVGGFSLRAASVAAEAHEGQKLERLCPVPAHRASSDQRGAPIALAAGQGALPAQDAVEERHDARGLRAGGVDGNPTLDTHESEFSYRFSVASSVALGKF